MYFFSAFTEMLCAIKISALIYLEWSLLPCLIECNTFLTASLRYDWFILCYIAVLRKNNYFRAEQAQRSFLLIITCDCYLAILPVFVRQDYLLLSRQQAGKPQLKGYQVVSVLRVRFWRCWRTFLESVSWVLAVFCCFAMVHWSFSGLKIILNN